MYRMVLGKNEFENSNVLFIKRKYWGTQIGVIGMRGLMVLECF